MGSHTRNVLTVKSIASRKAKKLRDGGGLWLVTKGSGRYWIFDYRIAGKRREMGLGPLHSVGLAEARQRAEDARALVRQDMDPIEHRRAAAAAVEARPVVKTFGEYADAYIDAAVKTGRWRGAKTEAGWRNTLTNHAAAIRRKPLADIDVEQVLGVLRPIWGDRQETAEKLRERIERVLDAAKVEGLRSGENPARWKGNLEHVLHKPDSLTRTSHHAAMPHEAVPAFWRALAAVDGVSARALAALVGRARQFGLGLRLARVRRCAAHGWRTVPCLAGVYTAYALAAHEAAHPLPARQCVVGEARRRQRQIFERHRSVDTQGLQERASVPDSGWWIVARRRAPKAAHRLTKAFGIHRSGNGCRQGKVVRRVAVAAHRLVAARAVGRLLRPVLCGVAVLYQPSIPE